MQASKKSETVDPTRSAEKGDLFDREISIIRRDIKTLRHMADVFEKNPDLKDAAIHARLCKAVAHAAESILNLLDVNAALENAVAKLQNIEA